MEDESILMENGLYKELTAKYEPYIKKISEVNISRLPFFL